MTQVDHSPVVVVRSSSSSGLLDDPVELVAPAAAADAANGFVAAAVVDAVLVQGVVEDADAVEADAAVLRRTVVNGLSVTCYLIITVTPNIEATFYQYFSSTILGVPLKLSQKSRNGLIQTKMRLVQFLRSTAHMNSVHE